MKLAGAAGAEFCRRPDPRRSGALLHGPDAGLLSLRRRDLVAAIAGDDPLSVTRLEPDQLRRDPAALETALRARGFFSGRPVVVVEGAKDSLAEILKPVLRDLAPGDGFLVVTAVGLAAKSPLRKLFEGIDSLVAIGLYPDPPGPAEIEARLRAASAPGAEAEAVARLVEIGADTDPGSFARLLETVALHAHGRPAVTLSDVEAMAPEAIGAELDALVEAVSRGETGRIGPLLARLAASGTSADRALAAVSRQFRLLFRLTAEPGDPARALQALRPPVFGPRRAALEAALRLWPAAAVEEAVRTLFEAERRLRSPGPKPEAAIVERCLLRLAIKAAQRRGPGR